MKRLPLLTFAWTLLVWPALLAAQQSVPLRDLVQIDHNVPRRLMGYGLVVGLDGTGDRTISNFSGGQTVQSVANLLRRFDIEVPPEVLRTRNVAAVLVTAEVSPYLRAGGRFGIQVASVGDAQSLRGGVLWTTPLVTGPGQAPMATAQGSVVISDGMDGPGGGYAVETSARIPAGGMLEVDPGAPSFADQSRLLLRTPSFGTALRIVAAINQAVGDGTAVVEDPGSVRLTLPPGDAAGALELMATLETLTVEPDRVARLIIDGRDGTVVAGGAMSVSEAVVSHRGITLSVQASDTNEQNAGIVQVAPGTSVQEVASALHTIGASPAAIASIFTALRDVGALTAEVVIR